MRRVLGAGALFNAGGALFFAFPSSLGQLAGMPVPVPGIYTSLLAVFVLLFGGAYAWLTVQPRIDRPLVVLATIGKVSVFSVVVVYSLLGELPSRTVLAASGDLLFATVFAWWLIGSASDTESAA